MRRLTLALFACACVSSPALAQRGSGTVVLPVAPLTVVGSLPSCAAGTKGAIYMVTDALTPVALSTVVGGGAINVLVVCNGTNWIVA
jgi:hypothetical protein